MPLIENASTLAVTKLMALFKALVVCITPKTSVFFHSLVFPCRYFFTDKF